MSVAAGNGPPVKREVLALFDGNDEGEAAQTRIHRFAEMPLNHLGYIVRFHDLRNGLPDRSMAARCKGVLTWFAGNVPNASAYFAWADGVARSGAKYVVLGHIGADASPRNLPYMNRLLGVLGLRHAGAYVAPTFGTRIISRDRDIVEFERPLDPVLPDYPIIQTSDPNVHVALALAAPTGDKNSALVSISDRGGFAAFDYEFYHGQAPTYRSKWLINPFVFFQKALGAEQFPIPDTTTVSGRRLYFSHINGDGWNNSTQIERYREQRALASEVLLKELIEPYPDLPVTVGLSAGDIDAGLAADRSTSATVLRRLLALPHVEIAIRDCAQATCKGSRQSLSGGKQDPALIPLQQSLSSLERGLRAVQFNTEQKPVMVLQWTGDAVDEKTIASARIAGLHAIGARNTRFDAQYPSVAYLAPLSRPVGSEHLLYAVGSDESSYTNNWTGPFYGLRELTETLRNTEMPRRLKGFNLHYHAYTAEVPAALEAVKAHLEAARNAVLMPIKASDYAAIAEGYFSTELVRTGPIEWEVRRRGALQTVRFDDAAALSLDRQRSRGVLGMNRHAGSLYVALDQTVSTAVVALHDRSAELTGEDSVLSLVDSRWHVTNLTHGDCRWSFAAQGAGDGKFTWDVMPSGVYLVSATRAGQPLWSEQATAKDGRIRFTVPLLAREPLTVEIACATATKDNG